MNIKNLDTRLTYRDIEDKKDMYFSDKYESPNKLMFEIMTKLCDLEDAIESKNLMYSKIALGDTAYYYDESNDKIIPIKVTEVTFTNLGIRITGVEIIENGLPRRHSGGYGALVFKTREYALYYRKQKRNQAQ